MSEAAEYWGERYFDASFNRAEWQAHPATQQYQCDLQGGMSREKWFAQNYIKHGPVKRAASIGAGRAEVELELLTRGYVEHVELFDISPVGIEHARQEAAKRGLGDKVTCHVVEPGIPELPRNRFDLIIFVAALHHMPDIRKTLLSVEKSLRKNGMIWCANEYVGPDRFDYPKTDMRFAREYHATLPEHFKKNGYSYIELPTPEDVVKADPTEAPHSSKIIPTCQDLFPDAHILPMNGAFAFTLFWGLNHDALYAGKDGYGIVEDILTRDRALTEERLLPAYFAHLVIKKRSLLRRAFKLGWRRSWSKAPK